MLDHVHEVLRTWKFGTRNLGNMNWNNSGPSIAQKGSKLGFGTKLLCQHSRQNYRITRENVLDFVDLGP